MESRIAMSGGLGVRKIEGKKAPLAWRLRNMLRVGYLRGLWMFVLAHVFSRLTGIITVSSELRARVRRVSGEWVDYGVLSYRYVTDTGVGYLVDCWDATATVLANLNYHGCGTGVAAENQTDSALGTESTTVLNPDSTRATGTRSQPTAYQYRSVGTLTFDGSGAITEHGLLSQAATGGGVLWDRSVFTAINVASGDSIQFTYTVTMTAGG